MHLLEDCPISNYLNSHLWIPEISGHAIWYTDTRSNNHTTPILTRHLYHIRQHTTRISDLHLQQTLVITTIQSMAVLPNNLHQYWGHRGYLATTSIEAITNILRSEILRNLNDNDVLKNPLELNSPEENQVRQEAPRQNSVTSASYRFQKYPRDPKKNLSEKRSRFKLLRQDSSPEHRRGEKRILLSDI